MCYTTQGKGKHMDLNQIFIKYYPEWTAFEAVVFFSVLIGVTAILLIQVLRKHIRWVQAVSVLLLVTYLMLVFGSTVFMRQPGTRQAEYEWFWSWKVVYHAFEEGYTHSLFWEILLNIALLFRLVHCCRLRVDGNEVFGWRWLLEF